jgi:uncharacterized protein YndB with AHSA1/START domain
MRIEASVVIDRPREEVWEYLATPSNAPEYFSHMVSYEATSPLPLREGSTMAGKMQHGPIRARLDQVVTRVVENELLEWKDANPHIPNVQSFTLSDADGATTVVYRYEGTPQDLVGRILKPLAGYLVLEDAWSSMDRLKRILDGLTGTHSTRDGSVSASPEA